MRLKKITNANFVDEAKFNKLAKDKSIAVAIRQTKNEILEYCNRKDNTDEVIKLYKELYNINKNLKFHLKEFLLAACSLVATYIFAKYTDVSEQLSELTNSGVVNSSEINLTVIIVWIVVLVICLIFFLGVISIIGLSFGHFILKSLRNFHSEYDLFIMPYLCDMLYERLKSEGMNPLKINFE